MRVTDQVPRSALTVGVATVMDAREVVIIITGIHKAFALSQCIERGVSHMYVRAVLVTLCTRHHIATLPSLCLLVGTSAGGRCP
jgi:6-phosphogluconolactonase/glucosamine-6-phosphate isomerase/deaminase